jgi:SulP family sulfate permease
VIGASGIIFGVLLLLFALTGMVDKLAKLFTPPVVRGIQLALGLVFLKKGTELIVSPHVFLNGLAGIALAVPNMAWAFGIGIAVDLFIRKMRIKI